MNKPAYFGPSQTIKPNPVWRTAADVPVKSLMQKIGVN